MLSEIQKFVNLKNPLFRFFLFLVMFAIISAYDIYSGSTKRADQLVLVRNFILCGLLGFSFFYVSRFVLKLPAVNPFNVWISSLLIYILVHPTNGVAMFVLVFVGMFVGKYYFKLMNLPVFNPAAFGLFFALYVSNFLLAAGLLPESLLISWWGADLQQQMFATMPLVNSGFAAALLLGFLYFANKFKKTTYSFAFFLTYLLCFFVYNIIVTHQPLETIDIVAQAFFNSIAFMALVMIPEPKTSPTLVQQQMIVGMFAGLALFLYTTMFVKIVAEPFVTTILTANILTYYAKKHMLLRSSAVADLQ